jgi:hypothetical protein
MAGDGEPMRNLRLVRVRAHHLALSMHMLTPLAHSFSEIMSANTALI